MTANIEQLQAKIAEVTSHLEKLETDIETGRADLEQAHGEVGETLLGLRDKQDAKGIDKIRADLQKRQEILNSLLWQKGALAYRLEGLQRDLNLALEFEHKVSLWKKFGFHYVGGRVLLRHFSAMPRKGGWNDPDLAIQWLVATHYKQALDAGLQLGYRFPADADPLDIVKGGKDILRPLFDDMIRLGQEWHIELGPTEDEVRLLIESSRDGDSLHYENIQGQKDYRPLDLLAKS